MPGSKQACPNSAACWSPSTPETGTPSRTADGGAEVAQRGGAEATRRRTHLGEGVRGHAEERAELGGPGERGRIEQEGAAGVGGVGGVGAASGAAGQVPQHPGVDRAEGEVRIVGREGEVAVAEQPGRLGGAEVGVEDEAGGGAHEGEMARLGELGAEGRRAPVLPDDGAVQRTSGRAVEGHQRLALVGDADGGDGVAPFGQAGADLGQGVPDGWPRSRRGRARPSRAGGSAGSAPGRPRRPPGPARRRRGRAPLSCPHRWRRRPWP